MERSQLLAQALQAMSAAPQQGAVPGMDPSQMAQAHDQIAAWKKANPGQSHIAHGLGQMAGHLGIKFGA